MRGERCALASSNLTDPVCVWGGEGGGGGLWGLSFAD